MAAASAAPLTNTPARFPPQLLPPTVAWPEATRPADWRHSLSDRRCQCGWSATYESNVGSGGAATHLSAALRVNSRKSSGFTTELTRIWFSSAWCCVPCEHPSRGCQCAVAVASPQAACTRAGEASCACDLSGWVPVKRPGRWKRPAGGRCTPTHSVPHRRWWE